MNIIIESSCLILSAIFISLFLAPNNNNSHLTLLYIVRYRLYNKKEKTPTNRQVPKSQHLATVGSKISLLSGRNLQQTRLEEGQPSSRGSLFFPPPPPSSTPHPFLLTLSLISWTEVRALKREKRAEITWQIVIRLDITGQLTTSQLNNDSWF